jgi:hypothetical protein
MVRTEAVEPLSLLWHGATDSKPGWAALRT